jgi:hypothetical protein
MTNLDFTQPVWTAGYFISTQNSYINFPICQPLARRPERLDIALQLDHAERLLRERRERDAVKALQSVREDPLAQPLLLEAVSKAEDNRLTIDSLLPPSTPGQAVILGHALLQSGSREEVARFFKSEIVRAGTDANVRDVVERLRRKFGR